MERAGSAGGAVVSLGTGSSLGPYRVEGVLSHGGMGIVYRATEVALGRPVALKVIHPAIAWQPGFSERFEHESRFAASVDHPHIVPVYAAGECEGVLFIAMRLVDGTDLRSLIAAEGALSPARAADIVAQVASALDAAHTRGIVHRDVKPANVLLEKQGDADHAYLTDFGVTKRTGSVSGVTGAGRWVGTVDYVAPEQIRGEAADVPADVYGLGCMLYEALTGKVPFPRVNELAKLWAHASNPPPSASDAVMEVPPALAAVAQRAMAKRPDERYPTAGELGAAAVAAARGDAPPAASLHAARPSSDLHVTRLPAPLTPTIGREDECAEAGALLRRDGIRLVSLLGPGGVGKSRLALEVARAIEGDFSDGAWFVELAAAPRTDQVAGTVASALELAPAAGETVAEALVRFLRPRRALLVLDNFEHVLPAADLVHELLSRCAGLKVLATSRSALDIRPEHRMTVDPLGLPVGESPGEVRRSPAGALFLDRARSQGAQLSVDSENAGAIAAICRRLDGLPLAIELAAARAPMLAPHELSSRLAGALDALRSAARDAPARQRTLRATIDWSCRLLEPGEAAAFARFAVFSGGASITSAEEVIGADLDTLEGLAGKHLVIGSGGGRVHMLETVREYARERLGALPDARDVAARHRDHYVALAERAEPHLYTHGEREWLRRLDADASNLRAAFDWAVEEGDPCAALRLAGLLHAFWVIRGRVAEGLDAVRRALAAAGDGAPLADRALAERAHVHLLIANGAHYDWQGARGEAEARADAAVQLSREVGEPRGIADALLLLSSFADTDRAPPRPRQRALAEEALALARGAGDERLTAFALMTRAIALPVADAEKEVEEAATALRDVGDARHLMWLYSNTAYNALMEGFVEPARPLLDRALPLARELGYPLDLALACGNAGLEALFSGDLERAQQAFDEMLRTSWDQVGWLAAEGLVGFAAIAAGRRDPELAAQLLGAAQAIGPLAEDAVTVRLRSRFLEPARDLLGDERWAAAESQGSRLSFDEAIALALDSEPTVAPPVSSD